MKKRFNPSKPIDIYNSLPKRFWPFKFGERVWCITKLGVKTGRIDWYHPAREMDASFVISPDSPFYCVVFRGSRENVSARKVFKHSKAGRRAADFDCYVHSHFEAAREARSHLWQVEEKFRRALEWFHGCWSPAGSPLFYRPVKMRGSYKGPLSRMKSAKHGLEELA